MKMQQETERYTILLLTHHCTSSQQRSLQNKHPPEKHDWQWSVGPRACTLQTPASEKKTKGRANALRRFAETANPRLNCAERCQSPGSQNFLVAAAAITAVAHGGGWRHLNKLSKHQNNKNNKTMKMNNKTPNKKGATKQLRNYK